MNPKTASKIDGIIKKYSQGHGRLLGMLEEIQRENPHNYLPEDTLAYVARKTCIPYAKIYGVVTFYSFFNLIPQGDHCISICRGTACHTKGSKKILDYLRNNYDFEGEDTNDAKLFLTTRDRKITLRSVACFGQCALAPVVEVDGEIYGNMTVDGLKKIIEKF